MPSVIRGEDNFDSAVTGGGSYDLLGTILTTSGFVKTLNNLDLTGYNQVHFAINGVTGDEISSTYLLLNGYRVTQYTQSSAGDFALGLGTIDLATGIFSCTTSLFTNNGNSSSSNGGSGLSGITIASTSITFSASGGSFNGGSITIYGVA